MTDLVRQARELGGFSPEAELCSQMADEIERLRDECARFRAALNAISCQDADYKDEGVVWCAERARAALGEKE